MLDLTGKNALVTGIANNHSIAWGIAQQLHKAGANLGVTYLPDERGRFRQKVADLTAPLNPSVFMPCNVQDDGQVGQRRKLCGGQGQDPRRFFDQSLRCLGSVGGGRCSV